MIKGIRLFSLILIMLIFIFIPACNIWWEKTENTQEPTSTIAPASTPAPTSSSTHVPTTTPTSSPTPTPTITPTTTPSPTPTTTPSPTPTTTPSPTSTPTPTSTSAPTPTPTSTPTPTPTPSPTPTSTPEPLGNVGLYFSPQSVTRIQEMWPAENTPKEEFGSDYMLQVAIDFSQSFFQINYIFKTSKTASTLKTEVGNSVFGEPMTDMNRTGDFIGETNDQGDPLGVMLYLEESPSTNYINFFFRTNFAPDNFIVLFELLEIYIEDNRIISNDLPPENTTGEGFAYDSASGESAIWRYWKLEKSNALALLEEYRESYSSYPEFVDKSNISGNPKYISFVYDVWDDGVTLCIAYIQVYNDGTFRIAFGTRNKNN